MVVAELGRLGIVATTFSGNVPDIDILAYKDGKSVAIQVKANRQGNISVDGKRYLDIQFDGDTQTVIGKSKSIDRDLIFVWVSIGEEAGGDRYFVCDHGFLQDRICDNYTRFLKKHSGVRPRNPKTTHCACSERDFEGKENNWSLVIEALRTR